MTRMLGATPTSRTTAAAAIALSATLATALTAFALLAAPTPAAAQTTDERVTTLDGVYTAEQAERGRRIYQQSCAGCHALDWYQGDAVRSWQGAPLYNLFDVISTNMPEDNPGSLTRRQYVDVLAYILGLNDLPTGDQELSTGASRLRQILIQLRNEP